MQRAHLVRILSAWVLTALLSTITAAQPTQGRTPLRVWTQGNAAQSVWASASYPMVGEPGMTQIVPLALYDYSGHSTWIAIQNCGAVSADIDLDFYVDDTLVAQCQLTGVPALAPAYFDLAVEGPALGLPAGWSGWVVINSASLLSTAVLDHVGSHWATMYAGQPAGSQALYVPILFRRAALWGETWASALLVRNVGTGTTNVSVSYSDGEVGAPFTLGAGESRVLYTSLVKHLPTETFGAIVTSDAEPVVAVDMGATASGDAFASAAAGASTEHLAISFVMSGYHGWDSAFAVMNASNISGTVDYWYPTTGTGGTFPLEPGDVHMLFASDDLSPMTTDAVTIAGSPGLLLNGSSIDFDSSVDGDTAVEKPATGVAPTRVNSLLFAPFVARHGLDTASSLGFFNPGTATAMVAVYFYDEAGFGFVPITLGYGTPNPFTLDPATALEVYLPVISELPDGRYSVVVESTEPLAIDVLSTWSGTGSGAADLTPSGMSASRDLVAPGAALTYTVTLLNGGTIGAAGVQVTATIPTSTTYLAGSLLATDGDAGVAGDVITWTGDVNWGAPVELRFAVAVEPAVPGGTVIQAAATIADDTITLTRTTTTTVEAEPPLILTTRPGHGATGVELTTTIGITFSEAMDTGSFTYICAPNPGGWIVTWQEGEQQVELQHAPLAPGEQHTCTVQATDCAGNPLDTGPAPNPWSFITVDVEPPMIQAVEPQPGAVDIALTATLHIMFSEPVDTGSFTYTCAPDPGGWQVQWSLDGDEVELDHAPFAPASPITCTVDAEDLFGNGLVSGPVPTSWSFTTGRIWHHVYLPLVSK